MRSDREANPPLFELLAGRLTGKVCSGVAGGAERREGAREGRRLSPGHRYLLSDRSECGRGPGRRQGMDRSHPLCDSRESRRGGRIVRHHPSGVELPGGQSTGVDVERGTRRIANTVHGSKVSGENLCATSLGCVAVC